MSETRTIRITSGDSLHTYGSIGTMDYTYFVDNTLNISNSTHLIYPHGGDIWGNIYDWKRIDNNQTKK